MEQKMERDILQKLKRQKHRRFWSKLVSVMMCIVVFCTTYALILPAITLETDTFCGKEAHTHTVDCYPAHGDLICTIEAHIHTDACNPATEATLVCELQEVQGHSHTESCNITEEKTLICQVPESAGHIHTAECSTTEQVLTCLLEETEGHSHEEACFADTLTCTLPEDETHTHETACYTQQLICALPEVPSHAHGASCYNEVTSNICGLEESEAHTHTDECYSITACYGCGLEEDAGHTHTEDCYRPTVTYSCALEETDHTHTESCYAASSALVCVEEDHVHDDSCYAGDTICGQEEHEHTLQCFSDPNADLETASVWKNTLPPLTGQYSEDVLAIARSQLGYTESSKNYMVADSGVVRGYTRYGAWYGYPYGDWCAMFVSFCLHYAEVEDIPLDCTCDNWVDALISQDMYAPAADYIPLPGDLIFFDWNEDSSADHVGLVAQYFPEDENSVARVQTIEGNSDNTVRYTSYNQADPYILGYGILPEQPEETTSHDETVIPSETAVPDDTEGSEETEVSSDTEVPNETEGYEVITKHAVIYTDSTYAVPTSDATVITISGAIPPDVEIKAFPVTLADAQVVCAYDIAMFLPDGTVYEPTELVTVSIQPSSIPQEDLEVYYHPDQGEPQKMDTTVTDDGVIFDTNHFSTYAVWAIGDKYDLGTYIQEITVYRKGQEETNWTEVTDGTVYVGDSVRFTLTYLIDAGKLDANNRTMTYQVPVSVTKADSGLVYNDVGTVVGSYSITSDGLITITFTEEYAASNGDGAEISGFISFETTVEALNDDNNNDIDLPFKENIHLEVEGIVLNTEDLQVDKQASNANVTNGTVDYTIVVFSQNGTGSPITLTDVMTNIDASGDITVQKGDSTINPTITENGSGFSMELPALGAGESYTITYSAKIPGAETLNGSVDANNKVTVESTDKSGNDLKDEDQVENHFERDMLEKTGTLNGDAIDWTITINTSKVDIGGWVLSDRLNNQAYTGTVTINPAPPGSGNTITLPYTFPSGSNQTYTVNYSTTVSSSDIGSTNYTNTAVLLPPGNNGSITDGDSVSSSSYNPLTKEGIGAVLSGEKEGDNYLAEYKWTTTIDAAQSDIVPYAQNFHGTSYNAWVYNDELWNEARHWMTGTQIKEMIANLQSSYNGSFTVIAYRWTGTGNKYQQPVVLGTVADTDKFGQFRILFHDTLSLGSKIQFTYSTTVNVGDSTASVSATNYSNINNKVSSQDGQSYKPIVEKKDKNGSGSTTEHSIADLTLKGVERVLGWDVKVTIPENMEFEEDLVIIEQIPPGTQLLAPDAPDWALSFGMNGGGYNALTEHEFDFSKGSEASLTYTAQQKQFTVTAKYVADTYVITVPKELANIRGGSTITIQVRVQINEDFVWDEAYKTFSNTVLVTTGSKELGSATQNQIIYNPAIYKAADTPSNNIIPYSLQINPDGRDLVSNAQTITLTDVLQYQTPTSGAFNVSLLVESVKVYRLNDDGTQTDITADCPFTFSEVSENGLNRKTLVITLPDDVPLLVRYDYRATGTLSASATLENTATLEGYGQQVDNDDHKITVSVEESTAGAILVGVKITKVDEENYSIHLEGAKYLLQKWNGTDYETVKEFTTSTDGSFSTGKLDENTAYRLVEYESPHGYVIDPTPYYFCIAGEGDMVAPDDFEPKWLNNGDSIILTNQKQTYVLPETGGAGTHMYTMAGLLLMLTSAAYLMYSTHSRRREEL